MSDPLNDIAALVRGEDEPSPKKRGRPKKGLQDASVDGEVVFESVREQARRDPVLGAPLMLTDPHGESFPIEPGEWTRHEVQTEYYTRFGRDLIDEDSGLPHFVPVQALGLDSSGASYYFFNTLGHVVQLKGEASKGTFELLFAGRNDFLPWLFPRYNKKGRVVGWEADFLKQAMTRWAGWCETFDDEENVRGRGMWRDDAGKPVLHAGNAVLIDGQWQKPGRYGRMIYPARPATGRPKYHPDLVDAGQRVLHVLESWAWERPRLDPVIKLGWIMTAKMAGALKRRPFIWVVGPRGSGKSFLQAFSRSLMHGALITSSNITAAGIYQKLGKDSIPVSLDEQEAEEDTRVTDRIIQIIRAAYSGDSLDRGDQGGKAKSHQLRSSFLASSISKPPMESSDDSRMALLVLRKLPPELPEEKPYTEGEAYRMGQMLTRRCIEWFPRWDALLAAVESAMRTRKGHEARSLDTFAPFLAGYHIALHDDMPTADELAFYADLVDPANLSELKVQVEDWEKCMRHLLGAVPEALKHSKRKTIGQILDTFVRNAGANELDAEEALQGFRVCILQPRKDPVTGDALPRTFENALLFIPNIDPMLVDLFAGTKWAGKKGSNGAWNGILKQAPKELWVETGSTRGGPAVRGVGFKLKALWAHLNRDMVPDEAPKAQAAAFEPSPFDDPAGW